MYCLSINGQNVEGQGITEQVYNPATGEVFAEFKSVSEQQCLDALNSADRAFKTIYG